MCESEASYRRQAIRIGISFDFERKTYNPAEIDEETEGLGKRARNITEREKLFVAKFSVAFDEWRTRHLWKLLGLRKKKTVEKKKCEW